MPGETGPRGSGYHQRIDAHTENQLQPARRPKQRARQSNHASSSWLLRARYPCGVTATPVRLRAHLQIRNAARGAGTSGATPHPSNGARPAYDTAAAARVFRSKGWEAGIRRPHLLRGHAAAPTRLPSSRSHVARVSALCTSQTPTFNPSISWHPYLAPPSSVERSASRL
jgi:hypothetical protein